MPRAHLDQLLGVQRLFPEGETEKLQIGTNITVRISTKAIEILKDQASGAQTTTIGKRTLIVKSAGLQTLNMTFRNNSMVHDIALDTFKISCTDDEDLAQQLRALAK